MGFIGYLRQRMRRINLIGAAFSLLGIWCLVWIYLSYNPIFKLEVEDIPQKEVPVVFFSNFPAYYELDKVVGLDAFRECDKKCELTINSAQRDTADAIVVFSHEHIMPNYNFVDRKSRGQKWVFFAVESPPYSGHNTLTKSSFRNKFDYTMSYRQDSDFFFGYLKTSRRPVPATKAERDAELVRMKQAFFKKNKMVAWFVSHCETWSKREAYVEQLKRHIQVDVYGACGPLKCQNLSQCDQMVFNDYKFYLAFENTLCKDYASEKLYRMLHKRMTVPVVRGGADYDALCPPNSVVNTADFPSPESLARHLKKLAADEEAYVQKLQWGWDYQVSGPSLPWCQLCSKLHDRDARQAHAPYTDASLWWSKDICHEPRDI